MVNNLGGVKITLLLIIQKIVGVIIYCKREDCEESVSPPPHGSIACDSGFGSRFNKKKSLSYVSQLALPESFILVPGQLTAVDSPVCFYTWTISK